MKAKQLIKIRKEGTQKLPESEHLYIQSPNNLIL